MQTLRDSPGLLVTETEGLIVMLMRRSPDELAFKACETAIREVLTRQKQFSTLMLIPQFDGPTRAARDTQREFVQFMSGIRDQHLGMAIMVGVPGVKGMMVRLTVNGALMLARLTRPVHLLGTIADSLAWLRALPGQTAALSSPELLAEITALR